jgi:hypothetical protein
MLHIGAAPSLTRPPLQGYLVFPVDDVPAELHEQIYTQTCDMHADRAAIGGEPLALQVEAILRSPTTRGVLTSLLGPDFVGNPWTSGVLESSDRDQG